MNLEAKNTEIAAVANVKYIHLRGGIDIDSRVRSAMVSDALDICGIRKNVMSQEILPLSGGMKAIGFASTIEFIEAQDFDASDPYGPAIEYLDRLQPGDIAIVATGNSRKSAFWGELFSTAAKARGSVGVVSDGPLRDTREILEMGFAAFGTGTRPFDYKGRMKVIQTHEKVICGGVSVHQGDLIVADNDGVVVVPQHLISEVISISNDRAASEYKVLHELLGGASVRAVWDAHRVL